MRRFFEITARSFIQVILASLIATVVLTLTYYIPLESDNYTKSMDLLEDEGQYVDILENLPSMSDYWKSYYPGIVSVFNDWTNLHRAYGLPDKTPVYNAMAMCYPGGEQYARYWHGYAGILRVLLIFLDIKQIRFLGFIVQFFLVVIVFTKLRDKEGNNVSFLFLIMYILMMPLATSMNTVLLFGANTMFIALIVLLSYPDRYKDIKRVCGFFCILGCVACYIEEMMYAPMIWGVPAMYLLIVNGKEKSAFRNFGETFLSGVVWTFGYAGMWLMKFAIGSLILGINLFEDGINEVLVWTTETQPVPLLEKLGRRLNAIRINYTHYSYLIYALIIVAIGLWLSIRLILGTQKKDSRIPGLIIIPFGELLWLSFQYKGSSGHHIFDHRCLSMAIIAVCYIFLLSSEYKGFKCFAKEKIPVYIKKTAILFALLIVGTYVAYSFKETEEIYNANIPSVPISVPEDNALIRVRINPSYNRIKSISLLMTPESSEGVYRISLLENGTEKRVTEVPVSLFYEANWQKIDVNWKFRKQCTYEMVIQVECEGNPGVIDVIPSTDVTLADLSNLEVGGAPIPGQPYFWITYLRRPQGFDMIFYSVTWYAVFSIALIVIKNILFKKVSSTSAFKTK